MVTTKQIADAAHVSAPVVRKVLNGGGGNNSRVGKETRAKILRVAARMGYRPNAAARTMSTGRFNCLALLSPMRIGGGYMPASLMAGLHHALDARGLHLTHAELPPGETEPAIPKLLREYLADGLLINSGYRLPQTILDQIARFGTPSVWLNHKREHACVYPDDRQGAAMATRAMLERGHKRVAFLGRQATEHFSVADREAGYTAAMIEAGLVPQVAKVDRANDYASRLALYRQLLTSQDRPTAIIAYEAIEAGSIVLAAAMCGISIPQGLSVIAISAEPVVGAGLPVTTVRIPMGEVAAAGVEMVMNLIEDRGETTSPQALAVAYRDIDAGATLAGPTRSH